MGGVTTNEGIIGTEFFMYFQVSIKIFTSTYLRIKMKLIQNDNLAFILNPNISVIRLKILHRTVEM
jgi:hypothetical protein